MPTTLPNEWFMWQGNVLIAKEAILLNEDLSINDLTGMTAILKVWKGTPNSVYFSNVGLNVPAPQSQGKVIWTVGINDGAALNAGSYVAEITVTDASGYEETYQIPLVVGPNA